MLDEIREENLRQPAELHTLKMGHNHKCLYIVAICPVIEELVGAPRGQIQLGVKHAIVLKEQACGMVGTDLNGQFIPVEERSPLLRQKKNKKIKKSGILILF